MAIAPFCVMLGAGFLADDGNAVNPDAVATAGAAIAAQRKAGPERLAIAIEGPLADRLRAIARLSGGADAAAMLADTCPQEADRIMLVDHAGRKVTGGAILWPPAMADAGAGPAPEIARAIQEFVGLAVPRPLPPDRHPVSLLRLPASVAEDRLLAAAFASPWTSWVRAGEAVYVALDDAREVELLLALPGARQLGQDIALGRLRLLGPDLPPGARVLDRWPGGQLAVCAEDCTEGRDWRGLRFGRVGAHE